MSLDPDEAKTLGNIETGLNNLIKSSDAESKHNRQFRSKMYEKFDQAKEEREENEKLAQGAHTRIDTHETRWRTIKWGVGILVTIATFIVWAAS